jgi:hypothetical protein
LARNPSASKRMTLRSASAQFANTRWSRQTPSMPRTRTAYIFCGPLVGPTLNGDFGLENRAAQTCGLSSEPPGFGGGGKGVVGGLGKIPLGFDSSLLRAAILFAVARKTPYGLSNKTSDRGEGQVREGVSAILLSCARQRPRACSTWTGARLRGTVRAFLSPKPQWMAASRKKRAFPDRVALWRASQIGPRTTFNFEKGYGGSEVTPSTGSQARRTK